MKEVQFPELIMTVFIYILPLFCESVISVAWPKTISKFLPTPLLSLTASPRVLLLPFSSNHLCYLWDFQPQFAGAALPNTSLINITHSVIFSPAALQQKDDDTSWKDGALNFDWPLFHQADCATLLPDFVPNLNKLAVRMNSPPAVINEKPARDGVCEWIWGVALERQILWRNEVVMQDGPDDSFLLLLIQTAVMSLCW